LYSDALQRFTQGLGGDCKTSPKLLLIKKAEMQAVNGADSRILKYEYLSPGQALLETE
jgi:hypothetical protein